MSCTKRCGCIFNINVNLTKSNPGIEPGPVVSKAGT